MLKFYTAGESHGQALLSFLSGLPAGLPIDLEFIDRELRRRQLGYGRGGRQKIEKDRADIFAGVRHGQTIGAPIALRIENRDWSDWIGYSNQTSSMAWFQGTLVSAGRPGPVKCATACSHDAKDLSDSRDSRTETMRGRFGSMRSFSYSSMKSASQRWAASASSGPARSMSR